MEETRPMIQVQDLRVDYDDVCAVRDLNLQIDTGEIYGLIGPNGAGKTSTLRALMGLVEPTYGEILLDGVDLDVHHEEAIRALGFMPDFPPIYEDLTVREFLDLFAASYLIPADRRRGTIDRYLELVDLTEKRDSLTAGLSRGMKQRLMLAKTLLPEPQIVLLDEPASGMDPHGRALLRNIMRQLGAEGKTVLISSHILAELSEFCTSVGIMERGRMVLTGRVDEVTERVLGRAEMAVEVVSGGEALEQVLAADTRAGAVRCEGSVYTFPFEGGAEEASELLAALVAAGVRVASFTRKREGLEEVFLKVGAKEVS
jgi:ABC-2 type transport system ATP-binding protein